jgi:mercuric ion transport protein
MKLKTYFQNKLVRYGSIGAFVAALCCFTPLLVVGLAAIGLAGLTAYLDFVLLPALFLALGAVLIGVRQVRNRRRTRAPEESASRDRTSHDHT